MLDLGTLVAKIKIDSADAESQIKDFQTTLKSTSSDVKEQFGKSAKHIAGAATVIGGAMFAVTESTRDYRTEQAKLDTAFETAGFSAAAAEKTYKSLFGVLGDSGQATEAANHLAKLCTTQEELTNWTDICTGIYATFGDSLPIEGLTEAANETAKVGQVTGTLADALNWAGISEDDFNDKLANCSTEQERQQLILDTLNSTYSEASDNYKENAADLIKANEATAEIADATASFGEILEPLITTIKEITVVGLQWILDNKDVLIAALAGIGTGFLVFEVGSLIMSVVSAMKALMVVTKGMSVAQAALNLVMSANPLGLVATAIGVVVAAGVLLYKNWDKVKAAAKSLWSGIKSVFGNIKNWIVNKFNEIINFFKTLPAKFKAAGKKAILGILDGMKSVWSSITGWVSDKVKWLTDKLAFWRKGKKEIDGSHRVGLREVPYDGYIAELHKGEMILTQAEANRYQKSDNAAAATTTNYTVNFNGNYSFRDSNDIDIFMNKAQRLIDRRAAIC